MQLATAPAPRSEAMVVATAAIIFKINVAVFVFIVSSFDV